MCLDLCVLCDDSHKVGLAFARAVVDDRIHEEGALQPRLVPLRVQEGGVHGPVQELLVEQDAMSELHCGSTQNSLFGPENGDQGAVLLFIVFHQSSMFVTVRYQ